MDPLTAALNLAIAIVTLSTKIWEATPQALREAEAANWAKFAINIGNFITSIQDKINVVPK